VGAAANLPLVDVFGVPRLVNIVRRRHSEGSSKCCLVGKGVQKGVTVRVRVVWGGLRCDGGAEKKKSSNQKLWLRQGANYAKISSRKRVSNMRRISRYVCIGIQYIQCRANVPARDAPLYRSPWLFHRRPVCRRYRSRWLVHRTMRRRYQSHLRECARSPSGPHLMTQNT